MEIRAGEALRQVGQEGIEKGKTSKAELVEALKASVQFCDAAYSGTSDANINDASKLFGQDRACGGVLAFNIDHSNEHYGNIVTYMRIKGMAPPSSEPRPR